jgi:hypothetical protein
VGGKPWGHFFNCDMVVLAFLRGLFPSYGGIFVFFDCGFDMIQKFIRTLQKIIFKAISKRSLSLLQLLVLRKN